ncbi:MAG: TraX protein, partial [Clostridia bacterium]|nr:TraX protein [Clostridia bacterium]
NKLKISFYIIGWYVFIFFTTLLDAVFVSGFYGFYTNYIQLAGLLAIPLLLLYNGKLGPRLKYLFYIFYPAHLFFLYIINEFFIV